MKLTKTLPVIALTVLVISLAVAPRPVAAQEEDDNDEDEDHHGERRELEVRVEDQKLEIESHFKSRSADETERWETEFKFLMRTDTHGESVTLRTKSAYHVEYEQEDGAEYEEEGKRRMRVRLGSFIEWEDDNGNSIVEDSEIRANASLASALWSPITCTTDDSEPVVLWTCSTTLGQTASHPAITVRVYVSDGERMLDNGRLLDPWSFKWDIIAAPGYTYGNASYSPGVIMYVRTESEIEIEEEDENGEDDDEGISDGDQTNVMSMRYTWEPFVVKDGTVFDLSNTVMTPVSQSEAEGAGDDDDVDEDETDDPKYWKGNFGILEAGLDGWTWDPKLSAGDYNGSGATTVSIGLLLFAVVSALFLA